MLDSFLVFSLLAAFFWAIANLLDKLVLEDFLDDPVSVTFLTSIVGFLIALAAPFFSKIGRSSISAIALMMLLGAFSVLPLYLYMKSIQLEEVSRVVPIFSLEPVFVLILGAVFLQEYFTKVKYVGIFLTVAGAVMVSSKRFGKEFFHLSANKAFWLVISSTLLYSIYQVAARAFLYRIDFWNLFFWSRIGTLIPVALFVIHGPTRENLIDLIPNLGSHRIDLIGFSELVNNLAILLQIVALSLGPAALVVTATSVHPLILLVLLLGASYLFDKDVGEDLSRKALAIKTISATMIILGIYFIR